MGTATPKVLLPAGIGSGSDRADMRSVLALTVGLFDADPNCKAIVVCVPASWREQCAGAVSFASRITIVEGGATRQESVCRGLLALKGKLDLHDGSIVLIHDAARCCLTPQLVQRVVEGVLEHGAVTAAVPIVEALSRAEEGKVSTYVDRQDLWSIQTPQGFLLGDLVRAHEEAQHSAEMALDDATLVARLRPVHIVMGERLNIKVTNPHDLEVAEVILAGRR